MADRLSNQRLRVIAALVFATPLVALPLFAAVHNMPARAGSSRVATARAAPPSPARRPSPAAKRSRPQTPAATKARVDDRFVVKHILDTGGPIPYGTYFWDTTGAPAGPIVITVDLGAETLSVFRNGYEIGTAAIIFGAKGLDTPLGTFPITQKDADHVSNLYDAPMPYMLRLTNDGISIHASEIKYENATHGCIGIPLGLAKKLFGVVKLGDKVIVTKDKMIGLGQSIVAR